MEEGKANENEEVQEDISLENFVNNYSMLNMLYLYNLNQNLELIDELLEETQENKLLLAQESQEIQLHLEKINSRLNYQEDGNKGKKIKNTWGFKTCYLADENDVPPPKNIDVDLRKSLHVISVNKLVGLRWSKEEWIPMLKLLESAVIKRKSQMLLKRKENLVNTIEELKVVKPTKDIKRRLAESEQLIEELDQKISDVARTPVTLNEIELLDPDKDIDWLMIAALNGNKTAQQCKHMWDHYLKPSINKSRWTVEETAKLEGLVKLWGMFAWDEVAQDLGAGRTGAQCLAQYQKEINYDSDIEWTKVEDDRLRSAVLEHRVSDFVPWKAIVPNFPHRTINQLIVRFKKYLDPDLRWGRWGEKEDKQLLDAYAKYGSQWAKICKEVQGRSDVQCRDRYQNFLNPYLKFGSWSCAEDAQILKYVKVHIRINWKALAELLPGRTDHQVLTRCNLLLGLRSKADIKNFLSQKLTLLENELAFLYKTTVLDDWNRKKSLAKAQDEVSQPSADEPLTRTEGGLPGNDSAHNVTGEVSPEDLSEDVAISQSLAISDAIIDQAQIPTPSTADLAGSEPFPSLINPGDDTEENIVVPEFGSGSETPPDDLGVKKLMIGGKSFTKGPRSCPRFDLRTVDPALLANLLSYLRLRDKKRFITRKRVFGRARKQRYKTHVTRSKVPRFVVKHGDYRILQFFKGRIFADQDRDIDGSVTWAADAGPGSHSQKINQTLNQRSKYSYSGAVTQRHRDLLQEQFSNNPRTRSEHNLHPLQEGVVPSQGSHEQRQVVVPDVELYIRTFLRRCLWDRDVVDMPDYLLKRDQEILKACDNKMTFTHLPPCMQSLLAWRNLERAKASLQARIPQIGHVAYNQVICDGRSSNHLAENRHPLMPIRKPAMFGDALRKNNSPHDVVSYDSGTNEVSLPIGSQVKAAYKISIKRSDSAASSPNPPSDHDRENNQLSPSVSVRPFPELLGVKRVRRDGGEENDPLVKIYPSRLLPSPRNDLNAGGNGSGLNITPMTDPHLSDADHPGNPFFHAVAVNESYKRLANDLGMVKRQLSRVPLSSQLLEGGATERLKSPNLRHVPNCSFGVDRNLAEARKRRVDYPLKVVKESKEHKYLVTLMESIFLYPALLALVPANLMEEETEGGRSSPNRN